MSRTYCFNFSRITPLCQEVVNQVDINVFGGDTFFVVVIYTGKFVCMFKF